MNKHTIEMLARLHREGISTDDALALRRIAMTLHRWFELECGDGNSTGAWCITRGRKDRDGFHHDDDGRPFIERHFYRHGHGNDSTHYFAIPDRENDAKKRLAKIMAKYPTLAAYIQTDPRGAPLYIIKADDMRADKHEINYTRGVAVYK